MHQGGGGFHDPARRRRHPEHVLDGEHLRTAQRRSVSHIQICRQWSDGLLARELGPKGIRVNAVAPGITYTDMMRAVPKEYLDPLVAQIPLRRIGQPEDIANAFVFLASEKASYITGVILSVDGMART